MREGDPEIRNNQLIQYQGYHYQYDAFGRMKRRTNAQAQQQDYHYNSDNRMVEVRFADRAYSRWQRVEYDYDLLGRRTGKRLYRWHDPDEAEPAPESVHFIWDGMRLRGEYSPGKMTDVMYVYNGDGYEPLARVDRLDFRVADPETQRQPETRIYYYHTALNGLPEAMTSESGKLVYEARYELWGKEAESGSAHTVLTVGQNLRFAGQYFDAETGLHYNTFRFYAPECGRFTQPDPISIRGGLNLYQYAPNPLSWIDPWGLCSFFNFIKKWHDKRTKEIFGNLDGLTIRKPGSNIADRIYDAKYKGYDIEYKSDNFNREPRTQSGLERMKTQAEKDAKYKASGQSNPYWHFEHNPGVDPKMKVVTDILDKAGIPWEYGKTTSI